MTAKFRTTSADVGKTFQHACGMLEEPNVNMLDADTRAAVNRTALAMLAMLPDEALCESAPNHGMKTGAYSKLRLTYNVPLLTAVLERIAAAPTVYGHRLPIAGHPEILSFEDPQERLTVASAMQRAGQRIDIRAQMDVAGTCFQKDQPDVARVVLAMESFIKSGALNWASLCQRLWNHPPQHRGALFAFLVNALHTQPHFLPQAAVDCAINVSPLYTALLVRAVPESAQAFTEAHWDDRTHPTPLNRMLIARLNSAHGRLATKAWGWTVEDLLAGDLTTAKARVEAGANLPDIHTARAQAKTLRQQERGRVRGPKGGDPSRRPPPKDTP